jgi:murein DD-endopeptidase MepM/ murein hydrolase activator NlpD
MESIRKGKLLLITAVGMYIFSSTGYSYPTAYSFRFPLDNAWDIGCNGFGSCCVKCYHLGEDISVPEWTPVYAAADGYVKFVEYRQGNKYGGCVVIEHRLPDGKLVYTNYGHLKAQGLIGSNRDVRKGERIGYIATTGENGGNYAPHLHFGVYLGSYSGGILPGYASSTAGWTKPSDFILSHQIAFASQFHTQNPSKAFTMKPGERKRIGICWKNVGFVTWHKEKLYLMSCTYNSNNGYQPENRNSSFQDQTWHKPWRVCHPKQWTVSSGDYATFEFWIKAPTTPGTYKEYFHLYHWDHGWIPNSDGGWPGVHFVITVEPKYSPSDIACFYDYGNSCTKIHTFLSSGSKFNYQGPNGWWRASGYCASRVVHMVAGDFNGSGLLGKASTSSESSSDQEIVSRDSKFKEVSQNRAILSLSPNPVTTNQVRIAYYMSVRQSVTLKIFDISGRLIETLVQEKTQSQGTHTTFWQTKGKTGIYFVRLKTDTGIQTKKVVIVK